MSISFSGLGSGIDTASLVSQLMQAERIPETKITAAQQKAKQQVTAWTDLRTKMTSLLTAAQAVQTPAKALASSAASSDSDTVKATVTGTATPASYSLTVNRLAVAEQQIRTGLGPASMTVGAGRSYVTAGPSTAALDLTHAVAGVHTVQVTRSSSAPTAYGQPALSLGATDLTVSLDGAGPVTLALRGTYAADTDLVSDLNQQLTAAGLPATASLVGGRLALTGASEGSASTLTLGGGAATALGLPTTTLAGSSAEVLVDGAYEKVEPQPAGQAGRTQDLGTSGVALSVGTSLRAGSTTRASVVETTATSTLADLQTMLNATGSPVSAALVGQGATNSLVLSATSTGVEGALDVTAGVSVLSGRTTTTPASDAEVVVNGVTVTRSSNSLTDLAPGLTLDLLHKPSDGLARTVTVSRDSGGTADKVKALVDGLNTILSAVATATKYDVSSGTGGPLVGDTTARSLSTSLFSLASVAPASGQWRAMSQLGVTSTRDGRFSLDTAKLSSALAKDPDGVATVLSGFADSVATYAKGASQSGGLLANRHDGAQADVDARQKQYDAMEVRLTRTEARYKAQYSALETAMAGLKSQQSAMTAALSGLTAT